MDEQFIRGTMQPNEPLPDHVHKYMRVRLGYKKPKEERYLVFKCMKPGCSHYIRAELVLGQWNECWRCGAAMVMNQWSAQFKKPHCRDCTRGYNRKEPKKEKVSLPVDMYKPA